MSNVQVLVKDLTKVAPKPTVRVVVLENDGVVDDGRKRGWVLATVVSHTEEDALRALRLVTGEEPEGFDPDNPVPVEIDAAVEVQHARKLVAAFDATNGFRENFEREEEPLSFGDVLRGQLLEIASRQEGDESEGDEAGQIGGLGLLAGLLGNAFGEDGPSDDAGSDSGPDAEAA
jgi:hypothetical protein